MDAFFGLVSIVASQRVEFRKPSFYPLNYGDR